MAFALEYNTHNINLNKLTFTAILHTFFLHPQQQQQQLALSSPQGPSTMPSQSSASSAVCPSEWFVCDDVANHTRIFVIQVCEGGCVMNVCECCTYTRAQRCIIVVQVCKGGCFTTLAFISLNMF